MSQDKATPLHFSRFEFKYVLDQATRESVEAELGHFVELDPYVQGQPGHRYFVRSLYYDDARFSAFHEKHDGLLTRSKFRVRTYGRAIDTLFPPQPVMRGLLRGYTVMEVKFGRHVPAWFHRILQAHELVRRSISKVCAATEALGLASADT